MARLPVIKSINADSSLDDPMRGDQMEAMPRHDPIPGPRDAADDPAASAWRRYKALMSWMILASIASAALALLWLAQTGTEMRLHLVIATIAGVGFSVLVGTALMGLIFFSHHSGHDEDAGGRHDG
jgi:hypothetical protein